MSDDENDEVEPEPEPDVGLAEAKKAAKKKKKKRTKTNKDAGGAVVDVRVSYEPSLSKADAMLTPVCSWQALHLQQSTSKSTSKADLALQKLEKDAEALWIDLQACDITDESLPQVRIGRCCLTQRDHGPIRRSGRNAYGIAGSDGALDEHIGHLR